MPRMRGSAISGKPIRRGSLDLDTKAPLKRIRSSVNLWFDKVFGDVHLSPCPLEQVLGDDRPPDRRGRGHNSSWRALVMYTCWWLGVIHSRAPLRVEHSLRKSLVKAKPLPEAEMSCHSPLRRAPGDVLPLSEAEMSCHSPLRRDPGDVLPLSEAEISCHSPKRRCNSDSNTMAIVTASATATTTATHHGVSDSNSLSNNSISSAAPAESEPFGPNSAVLSSSRYRRSTHERERWHPSVCFRRRGLSNLPPPPRGRVSNT